MTCVSTSGIYLCNTHKIKYLNYVLLMLLSEESFTVRRHFKIKLFSKFRLCFDAILVTISNKSNPFIYLNIIQHGMRRQTFTGQCEAGVDK